MRRKFESADPLRRGARRPPSTALKAAAQRGARSAAAPASTGGRSLNGHPSSAGPSGVPPVSDLTKRQPPADMAGSGFQEFALKMCSDEDLANSRYHVLKFYSRTPVDPAGQFTPPIRLHRKDPRQLQVIAGQEDEEDEEDMKMDADGAPSQGGAGGEGAPQFERAKKRPFGSKRKTRQIHGGEKNDAARKLRYEEHYPWVMEDFDNKNTWISSYEAAQSNNYAVLAYDASSNGFKVIPLEKYYKMTPSARYATLSLEDAEERMESAHSMRDRWLMSNLQPRVSAAGQLVNADQLEGAGAGGYGGTPRLRTVVGGEERKPKYNMDEEMDYDDQEMFDDDEGAPLLDGPEEDLKEAEQRIKQEHMKANELLDVGRDNDIDNLFEDDESREDKQGRRVRKALRSLEKNQYYDTDDEENPYASESDSDSEDEIERVQQQLQQQQLQQQQNGEDGSPSKVKGELDVDMGNVIPLVSNFRKRHIDRSTLPRGTVVLQLPPKLLSNFPKGSWNPNIKREEVPTQGSSAAGEESDPNLLTREDVVSHIVSGQTNIKELLTALRPKLAMHPDNQERLKRLVKEVAKSKDKKLYLR